MSSGTRPRVGINAGVVPPRRLLLLLVGLLLLIVAVSSRTIYLQSAKSQVLSRYAEGQQQNTQQLPAVRGDILDRNGQELAVGEEAVTFYATPKLLENRAGTALQISEILELSREEEGLLVDRLTNADKDVGFVYVARQVPREKAEELQDAELPGIAWYDEERRMYPAGATAGQLIGTVNIDGKGLEGIEMLYDRWLTGTPGLQVAVSDPTGVPIDVLKLQRERDGKDVQLTLDLTLQQEAERVLAKAVKRFAAKSATAIVMDPKTGEILAMAGVPRVDPARWSAFPAVAKKNRAITDTYEPGSTFKVVPISAALAEGVTKPEDEHLLAPKLKFCDDKDTCTVGESHSRGTEWFTTKRILVESSNVGTITLAQRVAQKYINQGECGKCAVNAWIKRFGFGSTTGIDFPGESPGIMAEADQWSDVSIGNIPIGQGISVTPIQLISAYAAIANDGVLVKPHLLKRIGNEPPAAHTSRRVLDTTVARTMRNMFSGVVQDDRGTGKKAKIEGYEVAGKTGTANIAENGEYIKGRYNSSFVGFVPAKNPQLVTLVVVNDTTSSGGDAAAPAFEEITEFALGYLNIPPDGLT